MSLAQMGKAGLFSLAIAPLVGTSVSFGDSRWTMLIGLAVMLLAVGLAVGLKTARSQREYHGAEQSVPGEKISNNLVVLSSAAILAVYGAGYFRTRPAADRFTEMAAQQRTSAPVAVSAVLPVAPPKIKEKQVGRSSTPQASVRARKAASPPAPSSSTAAPIDAPAPAAAPAPATEAPQATPAAPPAAARPVHFKDGTYLGWGYSPHGDIQASVVVRAGKMASTSIAVCATRYPCSVIADLPSEVVSEQSPVVNYVSGATESSNAFMDAIVQALSKAL